MGDTFQARIAATLLAAMMSACAAPVGDFGRRNDGIFTTILSEIGGPLTAPASPERRSSFAVTDEERDLRNLGWELARPPDRDVPGNAFFEFAWWRTLPDGWYADYPQTYYRALFTPLTASHETRYTRLLEQARADSSRLPMFRLIATKVGKADGARRAALQALAADAALTSETERRIEENVGIIRNVCLALNHRLQAYRYVMGRMVVETPSIRAIDVESALDAFAWEITACEPVAKASASSPNDTNAQLAETRARKRLPPLITK